MPGFTIAQSQREDRQIIIHAYSTATSGRCPRCQLESRQGHGWHTRRPQDLPCIGQGVYLELTVRRFRCGNQACPQQTFVERFPTWLPVYARRTSRLTDTLRRIGFEVSAESSRRILQWLQITVSGDTILRIVKNTPLVNTTVPRVVGVDDWAIRKGQRYGTIIVDHETHQVLELVKGRLAEDIQPWFQAHPHVEIVTRDRSRDYGKGLVRAAPQAQQVLDRWHLLLNASQLAQRVAASAYRRLKQLPVPPELRPKRPVFRRSPGEEQIKEASRQRRLDLYNEVQHLKAMGLGVTQVRQHLLHHYDTIRSFYNATEFPERMAGHTPRSRLAPYWDYLETRFQAGCTDPKQLFQEVQAQGYPGGISTVSRWLKARRLQAGDDPVLVTTSLPSTTTSAVIPSSYALSWLLVLPPDKLSKDDTLLLHHIQQDDLIHQFYELVQAFRVLICDRSVEDFDPWLDTASHSPLKMVRTFAKGLRDEYPAVRAALEHSWSNGHTEGQITRLKFIKRQMYGRASFQLLRQKVLYNPGST